MFRFKSGKHKQSTYLDYVRNLFGNWPKLVWVFKRFCFFFIVCLPLVCVRQTIVISFAHVWTVFDSKLNGGLSSSFVQFCWNRKKKKWNDSAASKSDKSKSIAQFKLKKTHTPIVVCPMKYGYIRIICYLFLFAFARFRFTLVSFS